MFKEKRVMFYSIVRTHAWVRRFAHNIRASKNNEDKRTGLLTLEEIKRAEIDVILRIQEEAFSSEKGMARLKTLETFKDEHGVIRVKTKLIHLPEDKNFKFPPVLPGNHSTVQQMIYDHH